MSKIFVLFLSWWNPPKTYGNKLLMRCWTSLPLATYGNPPQFPYPAANGAA